MNFHVPADDSALQTPDELSRAINEELSGMLEELLQNELGDAADVTVAKQKS